MLIPLLGGFTYYRFRAQEQRLNRSGRAQAILLWLWLILIPYTGCTSSPVNSQQVEGDPTRLILPQLHAPDLSDRRLRVVATTSIIADVVANIGGDLIELRGLMAAAEDPHSYQSTPLDLVALEEADVVFVNGWNLEEELAATIEENFSDKAVPISAGIEPLRRDDPDAGDARATAAIDPHVWLDVKNVQQWARNVAAVLSALDPQQAAAYAANLAAYLEQLDELELEIRAQVQGLPAEKRTLVTNHDAFAYFAAAYGFDIVGALIPAQSTQAEPSASDLASLLQVMESEAICTIFAETTQRTRLAETMAAELSHCRSVRVLALYSGALGEGEAATYIGMVRSNIQTILDGLR